MINKCHVTCNLRHRDAFSGYNTHEWISFWEGQKLVWGFQRGAKANFKGPSCPSQPVIGYDNIYIFRSDHATRPPLDYETMVVLEESQTS